MDGHALRSSREVGTLKINKSRVSPFLMCFRARPVPDTKVHQILGGFVSWKSRLVHLLVRSAAKIVIISEYEHTGIAHGHENMVENTVCCDRVAEFRREAAGPG